MRLDELWMLRVDNGLKFRYDCDETDCSER